MPAGLTLFQRSYIPSLSGDSWLCFTDTKKPTSTRENDNVQVTLKIPGKILEDSTPELELRFPPWFYNVGVHSNRNTLHLVSSMKSVKVAFTCA